jgi:P-type conjugative transfer protein TrbJ
MTMNRISSAILFAASTIVCLCGEAVIAAAPASASGMPVFDATNYAENLLQASRALDQINNQVKSLQNETAMLQGMARNLKTIDFPQLQRMTLAMQQIDRLMSEANGIGFRVQGLDQRMKALFPGQLQRALSSDQRVAQARGRLDAAIDAYRRSMGVQAQVAENVRQDAGMLNELVGASQGAEGALQAQQAANQLLALSIKQQLQLESLMAAQFRDDSIERARRAQAEDDARAATMRFLGAGAARN